MQHTVEKLNTEPVSHSYDSEISHFVKSAKRGDAQMRNGRYEISHFTGWFPFAFAILFLLSEVGIWFLVAAYNPPVVVIGIQFREEVQYQVTVPMTAFQELSMELKAEIPAVATGKVEVPDGYATGKVRFLSLEGSPVTFGKDTVIARQGEVQYKLTQAVTVPGFLGSAGVAEAVVVADKPGAVGNSNGIGSYVLTGAVRVQGLGAISGGSAKQVSVFTSVDIEKMRNELEIQIRENAKYEISHPSSPVFAFLEKYEIAKQDFALPEVNAKYENAKLVTATALVKFRIYNPQVMVMNYAKPVESSALGEPQFRTFDESSFALSYIRKVRPEVVLEMVQGFQGSKRDFAGLVSYLRSMPEVAGVTVPDLREFRGLSLKVEVVR